MKRGTVPVLRSRDRGGSARSLGAACVMALALTQACVADGEPVRLDPELVLYDGAPYGDFIVLADAVRDCMQSDKHTLPRIVLVDGLFECHTSQGWKQVLGCTGDDTIYLVASVVVDTAGMLWSHELTHYFGAEHEDEPCGALAIEGFSLDRRDAGP